MQNDCVILTWGQALNAAETHGAKVNYGTDGVRFSAPMLPPGTDLYTWNSQQSFEVTRSQGALPLLKPDQQYQLLSDVQAEPQGSLYFKLMTYDRNQHLVEEFRLDRAHQTFSYPATAQSYSLALVMQANQSFHFRWVALAPASDLATDHVELNSDLSLTWIAPPTATGINLYVGRRDAESWSVPLASDQISAVVRLSEQELASDAATTAALQRRLAEVKEWNQQELPVTICGYGYPTPHLTQLAQQMMKTSK
ncbi:accessory Sec system protein Asp3 [Fructilactobacillus myrtifloralis]|uniref:Accessory Sec system protein Asp3 n=1 Tax=Fructilactobacillus myrtifloralis TaxID=2940301 RepID=A0ABY5BM03_9LACO|nr:accessory Sec system protein Asp3 [Fructilactobacillus myrtifloralis]USS84544.1 accessory Sec system protein Asp3 [Fructilactobacillus myrtifloralis]